MGSRKSDVVRDLAAEKTAIETLRAKFPNWAAKRMARCIHTNDFTQFENMDLADIARGVYNSGRASRTELSIYSVIRRFDALLKGAGNAVAATI